ncbi:MAG: hypothetical protein C0613_07465 [Desulfobulbaceae bacterium]|nr:MAG: hypothetical protein C0613_07465 [Desulfobulbaceae bacterium]
MVFQSFVNNAALLVALSYLYTLVTRRWQRDDLVGCISCGLLFGLMAVGVMLSPMEMGPGLIFDTRTVVISVAGLFCGPVTAAIAALVTILYRIWLGGMGLAPGIATTLSAALIGVLFYYGRKTWGRPGTLFYFYLCGLLVHAVMLLCMFILPRELAWQIVSRIAWPVMLIYPLATLLLALLLADQQKRLDMERQLLVSEERFRSLFEQAGDAIFVSDFDGNLIDVNQAAQTTLGYSREELLHMRVQDVDPQAPTRPALQEFWRSHFDTGRAATFESVHRRKDGTTFPVEIRAGFIGRQQPPLVLGLARDISARIQADEERRRLEEQLLHAQKMEAVGTLAGGIAHEFNNILAAMIGYAELTLALYSRDGVTRPEHLQEIITSGKRASELIKRILAFSRKAELIDFTDVDINEIVAHAVTILEKTLPREIRIDTDFAAKAGTIRADAGQLEQVLVNLATNAKDAMPDGGRLTIKTERLEISEQAPPLVPDIKPGCYLRLIVRDSGQGMGPDTVAQIFNPFFTTKEVGAGTGLGLSVVYGIIKGHHGYIGCHSTPGRGTTFEIYLPTGREQGSVPRRRAAPLSIPSGQNETVLLVDDEKSLLDIGKRLLEDNGYQVLLAGSGEEAVEIFRQQGDEIDLVLLDVSMPGMGGRRCLKELLALKPQVKVIIASGYAVDDSLQEILEEGALAYVAKPYTMVDLLNTIHKALQD